MKLPEGEAGPLLGFYLGQKQWTQVQLSQQTDISRQHVNSIIRGARHFAPEIILRISEALELTHDQKYELLYADARDRLHKIQEQWV